MNLLSCTVEAMSESTNPTVPLNITEKELRVLLEAVPYNSPYGELRTKLVNAGLAMHAVRRIKNRERKAARKAKPEHRANGPYLPVGDLGGERCVTCKTPWPCAAVLPGGSHHVHEDCCK